jgi:hypothetical protein
MLAGANAPWGSFPQRSEPVSPSTIAAALASMLVAPGRAARGTEAAYSAPLDGVAVLPDPSDAGGRNPRRQNPTVATASPVTKDRACTAFLL